MDFGQALIELKNGNKVKRKGWNGNKRMNVIEDYNKTIYDTYLAHVGESNDYETFGHAMAIILPGYMKIAKDLSDKYEILLERTEQGE